MSMKYRCVQIRSFSVNLSINTLDRPWQKHTRQAVTRWECRPELEEMVRTIRETNHSNGDWERQAENSPVAALRRSRGWRDLRHASRRRWSQRLQKGRRETNSSFLSASQYNVRSIQAKQKDGETLDSFHSRLRNLSKTCDFRKSRQRNQSTADYLELLVKFPSAQSSTYLVSWMLVKP